MFFTDRRDAGRKLAIKLAAYGNKNKSRDEDPDCIVLALPRGGVPVAFEVARALRLDLDVFLVRKLGVPGHEELAMGAIASSNTLVLNPDVVKMCGVSQDQIDRAIQRETEELLRREQLYRENRPALNLKDKVVILIDDGLATGATMRAAVQAVRRNSGAFLFRRPVV